VAFPPAGVTLGWPPPERSGGICLESRLLKKNNTPFALRPLLAATALAAFCAPILQAPFAAARESVTVATPFEVGESPAGNYLAALVAGLDRDTLAAATFFRETLRANPNNKELLERAFVASLANGNMTESFALAERLTKGEPANGLANLTLGVRNLKQKQWTSARARLSKSGASRQRDLTATLLAAWSYIGAKQPDAARQALDKLRDETFATFRDYHLALMADLSGRPDEARRKFEDVYKNDKNTLRIVDAYGRFLSRQGDKAGAIKVYEEYDKLVPRHPLIVAALTDLRAGKTLEPLVRNAEEGAAEVLYGLGSIGGRQGDELAAMVYLRLSLFLHPANALPLVSLADVNERLKNYEQAIDAYDAVPESSPMRTTTDTQIGLLLEMMGKSDKATKFLSDVVKENPKNSEAWTALGNLQRARKDFKAAIGSYTQALALLAGADEKSLWSIYYFRGISYERAKEWPQAEADFKKALQLYPDQPLVLNYLGYSWVDKGMNLEEAFRMLRRAVELRPQDGYIVDSLGWAHYKLGRYEEAVKELERAIELKPSDPVINDHLGDAYWKVGRKLEAQFQWNHARDLKPEPEDLPAILRKIEVGMEDPKPATEAEQTKPAAPRKEGETPKSGG
jgi:tetratricopeptide (TPR) repeat protein